MVPPASSVQSLSQVRLFVTPWTAAHQAFLSITKSWSLLKLISIELVMPSNHLILCRPLLLLPPIPPSLRVFSNESTLRMRWPKYWSFSFNISPTNEHPGLISFRMDWLDLLAVQGTLKILLQHHSSKASTLCCSAVFIVQHSRPYMTTGKTIALTRWTTYWQNSISKEHEWKTFYIVYKEENKKRKGNNLLTFNSTKWPFFSTGASSEYYLQIYILFSIVNHRIHYFSVGE